MTKSVLIVDDLPVDRRTARRLLAPLPDVDITTAASGEEALCHLAEHPATLVLTDLHMPQVDGLQLLRTVRHEYPQTPVIVMTRHGSEELAVTALNDGASGYISKKQLQTHLISVVRKVLDSIAARQRRQRLEQILDFTETRFALDNDVELLPSIIGYMQEKVCRLLDFDDHSLLRIGLAIHEAVTNAVFHGNLELGSELRESDDDQFYSLARKRREQQPFASRRVQIVGQVSCDEFRCVIRDDGAGFDVASVPDPLAPQNIGKVSGRGLFLIRQFMDEVRHNDKGNEITFIRHRCRTAGE